MSIIDSDPLPLLWLQVSVRIRCIEQRAERFPVRYHIYICTPLASAPRSQARGKGVSLPFGGSSFLISSGPSTSTTPIPLHTMMEMHQCKFYPPECTMGLMYIRFEVPVDVAMQEPRSSIVRHEAQSYIICLHANVDSIPPDRVNKIIRCSPGYFHNIEGVLRGSVSFACM